MVSHVASSCCCCSCVVRYFEGHIAAAAADIGGPASHLVDAAMDDPWLASKHAGV